MVTNARIQDLIRENRPDEIGDAIEAGEFYEMQTFAQSLIDLVLRGEVDRETAANAASNKHDFLVALEAAEKDARDAAEAAPSDAGTNGDSEQPKRLPSLGADLLRS
jgi:Tfp pilus assembly ATPase PilU